MPRPRRSRRLYFTNLISARPLMGPAGAGSLATVINAAIGNKARFDAMHEFFEGVGDGHATGVWEDTPVDRPKFRKKYAALNEAARRPLRRWGHDYPHRPYSVRPELVEGPSFFCAVG